MDIDEIKTLTDLMVTNDLSEIMIRDGDKRVIIRRGPPRGADSHSTPAHVTTAPAAHPASHAPTPVVSPPPAAERTDLAKIRSPMVGTFYSRPDPESPPFAKVGDRVNADTVICIIEAMKVFNEIKAEVAGTLESIEVSSGAPVEFGQVLMTVRVS